MRSAGVQTLALSFWLLNKKTTLVGVVHGGTERWGG